MSSYRDEKVAVKSANKFELSNQISSQYKIKISENKISYFSNISGTNKIFLNIRSYKIELQIAQLCLHLVES